MGLFGGWSGKNMRFGLEHNSYEVGNATTVVNAFYMNYSMGDWNFFARQDMKEIEDVSNSDESKTYVGAVWNPTKGLYISPGLIEVNTSITFG